MIKRILNYDIEADKKVLSKNSESVNSLEEVQDIINNLKDTFHAFPVDARGLSAVQIGELKRVCIVKWNNKEILMINPEIIRTRGSQDYLEGCLSVPGRIKTVTRAQKVWCKYLNEQWEECEIAEGGRMSDIIQHEIDHLNGICKVAE